MVRAIDSHPVPVRDWGRPLLYAYLVKARSPLATLQGVFDSVEKAGNALGESDSVPMALYDGVAGVGWLTAHVQKLFDVQDSDTFDVIDSVLLDVVCKAQPWHEYDLINGLVGAGVYFLERLPDPGAHRGLDAVVRALGARAEHHGDETTWYTPSQLLPPWQRDVAPAGYYNLGVAHGVPGIVGFLAEVGFAGASSERSDRLLTAGVRWLMNQCPEDYAFPAWMGVGAQAGGSRVAWCYGPLGLAVTLLSAASHLKHVAAAECAIRTAAVAATRRDEGAGVVDAGLCHGAAGNGHLFNRLYQATGRHEFREAAIHWFDRALAMRSDGKGVAGFLAWEPSIGKPIADPWKARTTFLTGATGIALALLAATSEVEPLWDRTLLCSLPVASPIGRAQDELLVTQPC